MTRWKADNLFTDVLVHSDPVQCAYMRDPAVCAVFYVHVATLRIRLCCNFLYRARPGASPFDHMFYLCVFGFFLSPSAVYSAPSLSSPWFSFRRVHFSSFRFVLPSPAVPICVVYMYASSSLPCSGCDTLRPFSCFLKLEPIAI